MISLEPIGIVHSSRRELKDDDWDSVAVTIELNDTFDASALKGIEEFSHAYVIFHLDRVPVADIVNATRHPRGNPAWPKVGIFAQRGRARPNRLGLTTVAIVKRDGRVLTVHGLDAVDGTPVLDIKPVMLEFLPRGPVRQPGWATELMRHYWQSTSQA